MPTFQELLEELRALKQQQHMLVDMVASEAAGADPLDCGGP
jgi:hypothetical protein